MRRHTCLAIASSVLWLLLAMPVAAAFAAPAPEPEPAAGSPVAVGLLPGTTADFVSPDGSMAIKCEVSTVAAAIGTEPIAPGTFGGRVPSWVVGKCATNIPGVTGVRSVSVVGLPYAISIDSQFNVLVKPISTQTVRFSFVLTTALGPVTVGYDAGSFLGAVSGQHAFVFDPQDLVANPASRSAPGDLRFSATYGPGFQPEAGGIKLG